MSKTIMIYILENSALFILLFAGIWLIKKAFHSKLSAAARYLLWAVVVLKLLLPINLPLAVSPWSIFNQPASDSIVQDVQNPDHNDDLLALNADESLGRIEKLSMITKPGNLQNDLTSNGMTDSDATRQIVPELKMDWWLAALIIWVAGALAFSVRLMKKALLLNKSIANSISAPSSYINRVYVKCRRELGIKKNVALYIQKELAVPAITGIFRTTLLLPQSISMLKEEHQLRCIIIHELLHYKRGDLAVLRLLNVLSCVYWFNPVVWLCFRLIREDMETACDMMVLDAIGDGVRRNYIQTIIDFAGLKDKNEGLQAALSLNDGRISIMRRIQSMFMARKTKNTVKLSILLLVAMLVFACFTTACQPTPEEEIVVGKNDGELANNIAQTPDISQGESDALNTQLGVLEHWEYSTEAVDGKLTVKADADIIVPSVDKLPVASAKLREFKQEDIQEVSNVLFGTDAKWYESAPATQEDITQMLIEERKNLENLKNENDSLMIEKTETRIRFLEKEYQNAPAQSDLKATDLTIGTLNLDLSDSEYSGVAASTSFNGSRYYYYAYAEPGKTLRYINISTGRNTQYGGTSLDQPYGVSLTSEQAAQQAKVIAAQLMDELTLCYVAPTAAYKEETSRNWGWACVFMRAINGCPTAYASEDVGEDMQSTVQEPIRYEKMVIVMDDQGIASFVWENPMTVISIDNENTSVLPFDEISQKAINQIINQYSQYGMVTQGAGGTVTITRAELGLMRIAKQNSADYYYLPVWNFFSTFTSNEDIPPEKQHSSKSSVDESGDPAYLVVGYPQAKNAVTINAIDGSIIDRNLGY